MCRLFIIIVYRELWFSVSNTMENDNYVFSCAVEHIKSPLSISCKNGRKGLLSLSFFIRWVCNDCYNTKWLHSYISLLSKLKVN